MLFGQNHHKMYCDYVPTLPGEQNAHTRKICSEFQTKKERVSLFFNFFFFFFCMAQQKDLKTFLNFFKVPAISILYIAVQVAILCCPYDHLRAQQIFVLEKNRSSVFFLQYENLLRTEVVIQPTNNRNVQCNICCTTSCKKILPYLILRLYKLACSRRSEGGGRREENRVV